MKPPSAVAALLGLLVAVFTSPVASLNLPADFKPPPVFRNNNLVHIISLEKNYAKEQLNVLVENISKEPQDEYYLPFTARQMAQVAGPQVKDRKDADAGPFDAEPVVYDAHKYAGRPPTLVCHRLYLITL